jgi:hypothetical protein
MAENLKMAFDARQNFASGSTQSNSAEQTQQNPSDVKLSPEVKAMVAEEVKQQLAAEKAAAVRSGAAPATTSDRLPPALDPAHTVFVVGSNLDVKAPDGTECELTPGDVINRIDDTPNGENNVQVRVASSKQGDCRQGVKPMVAVAELQEMSNSFREQISAGLQHLAENNGKNGLPAAPDTTTVADANVPVPTPDTDASSQIQALQKDADRAEEDVKKASSSGQGSGD